MNLLKTGLNLSRVREKHNNHVISWFSSNKLHHVIQTNKLDANSFWIYFMLFRPLLLFDQFKMHISSKTNKHAICISSYAASITFRGIDNPLQDHRIGHQQYHYMTLWCILSVSNTNCEVLCIQPMPTSPCTVAILRLSQLTLRMIWTNI